MERLTGKYLLDKGFDKIEKGHHSNTYRFKPEDYVWEIEVRIGDYPISNPNCGIFCIHCKEETLPSFEESIDDYKSEEETLSIAFYVYSIERFERIYNSLLSRCND